MCSGTQYGSNVCSRRVGVVVVSECRVKSILDLTNTPFKVTTPLKVMYFHKNILFLPFLHIYIQ